MTSLTVEKLLADRNLREVCFDSRGVVVTTSEFFDKVDGVAERMVAAPGARWAIDVDDAGVFAASFLGCLLGGKTPVVAPAPYLRDEAVRSRIDGCLVQAGDEPDTLPRLEVDDLPSTRLRSPHPSETAQVVLFTSGSTGKPKEVVRSLSCMEAEISTLDALWGGIFPECDVYSTVSHRHVYGLLFRVLWPLLTGRRFASVDLQYPEQLVNARREGQVLIASPAMLGRIDHLAERTSWAAVFSSGGPLHFNAADAATRVLGFTPIEVLGSTETSGVAWRRQASSNETRWHVLPLVNVRRDADGFLEVASPYSGSEEWLTMGDLVELVSPSCFELLGRGDNVAKIEGKRISLSEIELKLCATALVKSAAAVALVQGTRESVGVVLELTRLGSDMLDSMGKFAFGRHLRSLLVSIDEVARPRQFRFVEAIPQNAQGKRRPDELRELFEES